MENLWLDDKMKLIYYEFRLLDHLTRYPPCADKAADSDLHELCRMLELYENGELDTIFQMDFVQSLFKCQSKDEEFEKVLEKNINQYICEASEHAILAERQFKVMFLGAIFLQLFVQVNWTGPDFIIRHLEPQSCEWSHHLFEEPVYSKAKCLEYLWMSKLLLFYDEKAFAPHKTIYWWRVRFVMINQELLEERSPRLFAMAAEQLNNVFDCQPLMDIMTDNLKVQLNLEAFNLFMHYYEHTKAKSHLETLHKLIGLSVELFGALGKRTRFQSQDVAQLALRVEKRLCVDDQTDYLQSHLPKDLSLNDDVRLDKIQFKVDESFTSIKLIPVEQAIVLANYCARVISVRYRLSNSVVRLYIQKTNPRGRLVIEELLTYPSLLLCDPQCWSVQTMALIHRSICESDHRRTIERSMMQMQLLVDEYSKSEALVRDRLYLLYSVNLPPLWSREKMLAHLQLQLGASASALDIFLRLEMWDEVIGCYHVLQRRDKAEAVIREQLAAKETPSLWCSLGDATDDLQYYYKAWELSNHRSARAQKSLGVFYFKKQEYDKCVECLKKSVEINAIQMSTWFRLGYAAMQIDDWDVAAAAYRRCVNLEPESFEAWNNLANVYIKLNQKHRAWVALQEALKCQFQDPKIWQNYLLVCVDLGRVAEAVKAYHHLLDNDSKYVDNEVLGLMVRIVTEDKILKEEEKASADVSAEQVYCKLCELFGRITSKVINDGEVWKYYGDLVKSKNDDSPEHLEKVIRLYEKFQRCAVQQQSKWNELSCCQLLNLTKELTNLQIRHCKSGEMNQVKRQLLTSAKIMLNNIIVKGKKFAETNATAPFIEQLNTLLADLQKKWEELKELLTEKDG